MQHPCTACYTGDSVPRSTIVTTLALFSFILDPMCLRLAMALFACYLVPTMYWMCTRECV